MKKMRMSPRKFTELLFLVTAQCEEGGLHQSKLMKLLYFTEAAFFKKHHRPISGVAYFKNHFGPTPDIRIYRQSIKNLKEFIEEKK